MFQAYGIKRSKIPVTRLDHAKVYGADRREHLDRTAYVLKEAGNSDENRSSSTILDWEHVKSILGLDPM